MDHKTTIKDDPINLRIGKLIRDRRRQLGMTQGKLAEKLKITSQQIQKYETGTNCLRISRLVELSRILSIPLNYFFITTYHPEKILSNHQLKEKGSSFIHQSEDVTEDKDVDQAADSLSLEEIDDFISLFLLLKKDMQKSIINLVKELAAGKQQ